LILMDLIMPKVDGVEATRRIMSSTPCAIVVVTASVEDNSSKVFEAMGAGALDAVNTPVLEQPGAPDGAGALLAKIETIRRLIGAPPPKVQASSASTATPPAEEGDLVVIGASAGGPAALAKILSQLPEDFPAPITIIQHVDTQFAKGLGDWLGYQTTLKVRVAKENDRPEPGTVLLAGTGNHLVITESGRLGYTAEPVDCPYTPSIDVFLKSVGEHWRGEVTAVLLTGMGRDGAEGLRLLRSRGHHTIAQDRESSAVYGMPKAAVELGAAAEVLPLDQIAPRLTKLLSPKATVP
jgi:two-component system chemotaxis response regulator CheB